MIQYVLHVFSNESCGGFTHEPGTFHTLFQFFFFLLMLVTWFLSEINPNVKVLALEAVPRFPLNYTFSQHVDCLSSAYTALPDDELEPHCK